MEYKEEKKDLFTVDLKKYYPAHCISSDCKMGAGIAVPMKKKFKLSGLIDFDYLERKSPTCIFFNGVFNLITKEKYWHKPTYDSLRASLISMKDQISATTNHIVMPKIGSGLDGLSWLKVSEIIKEVFKDTDIEILVCYLE